LIGQYRICSKQAFNYEAPQTEIALATISKNEKINNIDRQYIVYLPQIIKDGFNSIGKAAINPNKIIKKDLNRMRRLPRNYYWSALLLIIWNFIFFGPALAMESRIPKTALKIKAVAGGEGHSLILLNDGTVWGCGANQSGQLSDGSRVGRKIPVKIPGLSKVTAIACGPKFSLALKKDGAVWGWGQNGNGLLGIGSVPTKIVKLKNIIFIAAGGNHAFAIKKDGTVWGWGSNRFGQLGDGTSHDRKLPRQIKRLKNIRTISCGTRHSAALKADGTVWVWGANSSGQLGDGTRKSHLKPVKVRGISKIVGVCCGAEHTLALKKDGTVLCWGANDCGQLGDGSKSEKLRPVLVKGLQGVTAITGGSNFNMALKKDGTLWGWGSDVFGELGDVKVVESVDECVQCQGKNNVYYYDKPKPVAVKDGTDVAFMACGHSFSMMVKRNGTIWSWGVNNSGQLAEGSVIDRLAPTENYYGRIVGRMVQPYQNITGAEARARLDQERDLWLLDVRTPEEYRLKHLRRSRLLPLDRLEKEIKAIIPDQNTPVLIYCKTGKKSAKAAAILIRLGYRNVSNLLAGIDEWPFETVNGE
jgi:alpha-tubulin suppressor-like RCC1 family protein/rhodanese-related sulfurtransferase